MCLSFPLHPFLAFLPACSFLASVFCPLCPLPQLYVSTPFGIIYSSSNFIFLSSYPVSSICQPSLHSLFAIPSPAVFFRSCRCVRGTGWWWTCTTSSLVTPRRYTSTEWRCGISSSMTACPTSPSAPCCPAPSGTTSSPRRPALTSGTPMLVGMMLKMTVLFR